MKNIFLTTGAIISALLIISPGSIHAQMGMMDQDSDEIQAGSSSDHAESVETVLQDILNRQNVSTVQELDLSKISDDDWELLGDAVMELYHPGEAHELMDRMMGGEGSKALRQMHINMGKAYLGYGANGNYQSPMMANMMGMMGGGMMGSSSNQAFQGQYPASGYGSMMGYGNFYSVHGVLVGITWVSLIAFLLAGAYFFFMQAKRK